MATQMNGSSMEYSAEEVGNAFVSQFYHILHEYPEVAYRFYQDSSIMTRPGPDGSLTRVTTMKGINDLILSVDYKGYKVEILTADAQASYTEGVIVLVTGCLTGKDDVRKKFTESFFLAPQEKGYFVLNDAFRFIDEDRMPGNNSFKVMHAPAASLAPFPEASEVVNNSLPVNTVVDGLIPDSKGEACELIRIEEKSVVTEVVVPHLDSNVKDIQAVVKPVPNLQQDTPKKSYSSIVQVMGNTGTAPVPTSTRRTVSPSNSGQQSCGAAATADARQMHGTAISVAGQELQGTAASAMSSKSSAKNGNYGLAGKANREEDNKSFSVYIGNLPLDVTVEQVELEFKKFGRIKRGGIQVRCSRGFCFGFVEFESLGSMQHAVKVSKVLLRGYYAFIEPKKTTTRVNNGGSLSPPASGGCFGGNFSSSGSYGRNGGGRRWEISNGGRNGDGYQRVYQNGGNRGGRQGVAK